MKNILYIEDNVNDFIKYKRFIRARFSDVTIYPTKEREDENLDNRVFLIKKLRNNSDESFKEITDYYDNISIDLYIVDISLNSNKDSFGIFLMNYLYRNDYLNDNFIVLSEHSFDYAMQNHLVKLANDLNVNKENNFVHKGDDEKLIRLIKTKLFEFGSSETSVGNKGKNNSVDKLVDVAISNPAETPMGGWKKIVNELRDSPRRGMHWMITFVFFLLFLFILYYGAAGIIEQIFDGNSDETTKLVFIESIFLYLLPLFVIFGFYEYYRQSTGALLNERNSGEYKPEKALISLNNSKNILLTTLLSFSLIEGIKIFFFDKETNKTTLISIGVFIVILMGFLIISHRKPKDE